jgi:hypothetical protein
MNVPRLLSVPAGSGIAQATALETAAPQTAFETDVNNTAAMPRLTADYSEQEYLVAGLADTYTGSAAGPATRDDSLVDYVTRILVRRPKNALRFSGRVLVEPFNTSEGRETDALGSRVAALLEADGDAWIGVTERASSQRRLMKYDAVRYADIQLPSNDVAWDILAQVGALARDHESGPLAGLRVAHVYLGGYSQSGCDTATFAMAIHPHARLRSGAPVFNGYFPAAHSGSVTPVASGASRLPVFESVEMGGVDVPVVEVETQTDVEGFTARLSSGYIHTAPGSAHIRRADSDRSGDPYRLYEVAGAPHTAKGTDCDGGGSSFPTPAFLRAALLHLFRWAEHEITPPRAARIELATRDVVSAVRVDEYGNAIGGVRSPFVDVPLARYEVHSGPGAKCLLVGRETALSRDVLAERYGNLEAYLREFGDSLDATVAAGFLLPQDRAMVAAEVTAKARRAFAPIGG